MIITLLFVYSERRSPILSGGIINDSIPADWNNLVNHRQSARYLKLSRGLTPLFWRKTIRYKWIIVWNLPLMYWTCRLRRLDPLIQSGLGILLFFSTSLSLHLSLIQTLTARSIVMMFSSSISSTKYLQNENKEASCQIMIWQYFVKYKDIYIRVIE